jgi:hypothetical protein
VLIAGYEEQGIVCPSPVLSSLPSPSTLLSTTVSEDAYFGTVDLTDFYLGTPNPNPPFLKVFLDQYSPEVLSSLHLSPFTKTDKRTCRPYCLFRADRQALE